MSRGLSDSRSEIGERGDRDTARAVRREPVEEARPTWPQAGLELPRETERERVQVRDQDYMLNAGEARTLATVGAFRVVTSDDLLSAGGDGRARADTERLEALGLLRHETIADTRGTTQVVTLTDHGKELLDEHRDPSARGEAQVYYAGIVKPRELRHDAQVYRLFRAEAARIEAEGGRVLRVVLDYELKREYQQYLNRPDRPADAALEEDRRAFAEAYDLPVLGRGP
jgi:DNA-binding MarR family transcriptional regulator